MKTESHRILALSRSNADGFVCVAGVIVAEILSPLIYIVGLVAVSVVLIGGFLCWQDELLDAYRTTKPFSMDLPEPALLPTDVDAVKPFLNSTNETRILVSHYDYHSELAGLLGDSVVNQPTLEEKVYP